jgi:hypothetical protein
MMATPRSLSRTAGAPPDPNLRHLRRSFDNPTLAVKQDASPPASLNFHLARAISPAHNVRLI